MKKFILAIITIFLISCSVEPKTTQNIYYEVIGMTKDISYSIPNQQMQYSKEITTYWKSETFTADENLSLYISANIITGTLTDLTARIYADGVIIAEQHVKAYSGSATAERK